LTSFKYPKKLYISINNKHIYIYISKKNGKMKKKKYEKEKRRRNVIRDEIENKY
jgi:hypothetical protein